MKPTDPPKTYVIRLRGHLGKQWASRFEGMAMTFTDTGETLLTGPIADQAQLHGLLRTIRDGGIELLTVNLMDEDQTTGARDS